MIDTTTAPSAQVPATAELAENGSYARPEAVLKSAADGFPVFPLRSDTRTPCAKAFWEFAATDANDVREMWLEQPEGWSLDWPVGISTTGFMVLDVDMKNGKNGLADLAELEQLHGELPPTRTVRTHSGGRHYYFRLPDGMEIAQRCGLGTSKGLDLKGYHNYVVGPGTVTEKGRYELVNDVKMADLPLAPEWLLALCDQQINRHLR
jgi:hypothetical protein